MQNARLHSNHPFDIQNKEHTHNWGICFFFIVFIILIYKISLFRRDRRIVGLLPRAFVGVPKSNILRILFLEIIRVSIGPITGPNPRAEVSEAHGTAKRVELRQDAIASGRRRHVDISVSYRYVVIRQRLLPFIGSEMFVPDAVIVIIDIISVSFHYDVPGPVETVNAEVLPDSALYTSTCCKYLFLFWNLEIIIFFQREV